MFDFNEKRKIRTLLYSKVSIGILLILTVILGVSVFERFQVSREMANKKNVVEEELEVLKQKASTLEVRVKNLQNERGVEAELRKRFDVVKEGEQMIIILDEEAEENSLKKKTEDSIDDTSFIERLKFW